MCHGCPQKEDGHPDGQFPAMVPRTTLCMYQSLFGSVIVDEISMRAAAQVNASPSR